MIRLMTPAARAAPVLLLALTWGCQREDSTSAGSADASAGAGGAEPSIPAGAAGAAGDALSNGNGHGGAGRAECVIPVAPMLATIHSGATLTFSVSGQEAIEVGLAASGGASEPEEWTRGDVIVLPEAEEASEVTVFARVADAGCTEADWFVHAYSISDGYPGPAGEPGSTAVAADDPQIVGWAVGWVDPVAYGEDVDDEWRTPERAVGPATRDEALHVVSLGNGGTITMTFDPPIQDGPGADFVVFENGYSDTFLELAQIEVSSDGEHFARFDAVYLGDTPVAQFGTQDTALFDGVGGKYRAGFGGPFDLGLLRYHAAVVAGQLDLMQITHVRVVDVIGDGTAVDSFDNPIFDPTPTVGSGGFDLDAIGVLNAAP